MAEADVVAGAAVPDDGRPPIFGGKLVKTFLKLSFLRQRRRGKNKLECLTLASFFWLLVIFRRKVRSLPSV